MWGRDGGKLEVHMNLMPPGVSKVRFFPYFGPSGQLLLEGRRAFQIPIFVTCKKKNTCNDIYARRLLKTK
jgi:hypothetical protein